MWEMHDAAETLLTEECDGRWEYLEKMLIRQGFNLLLIHSSQSDPENCQFSW